MHANTHPAGLFSCAALRYEVALDVIGAVIAHYAEEAGIERDRPVPDKAKLRRATAMQRRLRSERNDLDRRDAAAIESAISCWAPLARRLYQDEQTSPDVQAMRAEHFRQVNASAALEGLAADDEELAIQQLVILGATSSDEAVALMAYFRIASRIYNLAGNTITRGSAGSTVHYAYDPAGHLLGEYDLTGKLIQETVWLGDQPVATLRYPAGSSSGPAEIYYVHADHLNTPRRITRPADDKVMWQWESAPFGDTAADANPSGLGPFTYNLRFPGQVFDSDSGLHYNYYRDYDPGTGRYVESDPIGLAGGINTYSYVRNRPTMRTDRFGLFDHGRRWWLEQGLSPDVVKDMPLGHSDMPGGDRFDFTVEDRDLLTRPENPFTGAPNHFLPLQVTIPMVRSAIQACDRDAYQRAMHLAEDFFSHWDKGYRWAPGDKTQRCDGWGHAKMPLYSGSDIGCVNRSTDPSSPDNDPVAWQRAADMTQMWNEIFDEKCGKCRQ